MKANQKDLKAIRAVTAPLSAGERQAVAMVVKALDGTAQAILRSVSTLDEFTHDEIVEAVTRLEPKVMEQREARKRRRGA
jgi:VCBS repeat-containing protein